MLRCRTCGVAAKYEIGYSLDYGSQITAHLCGPHAAILNKSLQPLFNPGVLNWCQKLLCLPACLERA